MDRAPLGDAFTPTQSSQVGGGAYNLRHHIKITEHASPEGCIAAQRRFNNPEYSAAQRRFDNPEYSALLDNATNSAPDPFFTGPIGSIDDLADLDDATILSLASDAALRYSSSPSPSPPASPSPPGPRQASPVTCLQGGDLPAQAASAIPTTPRAEASAADLDSDTGNAPQDGKPDREGSDEEDHNKENTPPSRGRRPERIRVALRKGFVDINKIVDKLSLDTGLMPRTIRLEYNEEHGVVNSRSNWCRYEKYYAQNMEVEKQRVGDPNASISKCYKSFKRIPGWQELLSVNEEYQQASVQHTIRERRREYERMLGKFIKMVKDAGERHFDVFLAIVGNCVNEDASLGAVYTSPGLADLLTKRLGLTTQEFIGFTKTEAFDHAASTATQDLLASRQNTATNAEVKADLQVPIADAVPEGVEVISIDSGSDTATRNLNVDTMRNLCKVAIFELFSAAGHPLNKKDAKGKGKAVLKGKAVDAAPGHMPWSTLPQIIADEGLQLEFWPWGVNFPGQASSNKREGIKCLTTGPTRLLLAALRGETSYKPRLKKAENPDGVREQRIPVIFSAPPPSDAAEAHGHVLYANGTLEKNSAAYGLPKVPSAATTIKRKLKAGKAANPIPVSSASPPPVRITRSKKPPVRPLTVISDNEDTGSVPLCRQESKPAPVPADLSKAPLTPPHFSDGEEWRGIVSSSVSPPLLPEVPSNHVQSAAVKEVMAKKKANAERFLRNAAAGTLSRPKPRPKQKTVPAMPTSDLPALHPDPTSSAPSQTLSDPLGGLDIPSPPALPSPPAKRGVDTIAAENASPAKKARLAPDGEVKDSNVQDLAGDSSMEVASTLHAAASPEANTNDPHGVTPDGNPSSPSGTSLPPPVATITPPTPQTQATAAVKQGSHHWHAPPPVPLSTRPSPAPGAPESNCHSYPIGDQPILRPAPTVKLVQGITSAANEVPSDPTAPVADQGTSNPGVPAQLTTNNAPSRWECTAANQVLGGLAPAANQVPGGWDVYRREPGYFQLPPGGAYHIEPGYFSGTPGLMHYAEQGALHPLQPPAAHEGRGRPAPYGVPPNSGHFGSVVGPFNPAPIPYGAYAGHPQGHPQYVLPVPYGTPAPGHMNVAAMDAPVQGNAGPSRAASVAPAAQE